ncbi:pentapeptide repeat-containing protein [Glaciihabitans sp. UYNi722]|uniref:pentapeptide repeat-containing protein n=1 Tax=Glaciihabitans sp. UYNi722 TaxID=3156344 RepID=UPI00339A7E56
MGRCRPTRRRCHRRQVPETPNTNPSPSRRPDRRLLDRRGCHLRGAYLIAADLRGCDLSGVDLLGGSSPWWWCSRVSFGWWV